MVQKLMDAIREKVDAQRLSVDEAVQLREDVDTALKVSIDFWKHCAELDANLGSKENVRQRAVQIRTLLHELRRLFTSPQVTRQSLMETITNYLYNDARRHSAAAIAITRCVLGFFASSDVPFADRGM